MIKQLVICISAMSIIFMAGCGSETNSSSSEINKTEQAASDNDNYAIKTQEKKESKVNDDVKKETRTPATQSNNEPTTQTEKPKNNITNVGGIISANRIVIDDIKLRTPIEYIYDKYGIPDNLFYLKVNNVEELENVKDKKLGEHTYSYDKGLRVVSRRYSEYDKQANKPIEFESVEEVSVYKESYTTQDGVSVGMSIDDVIRIYGEPYNKQLIPAVNKESKSEYEHEYIGVSKEYGGKHADLYFLRFRERDRKIISITMQFKRAHISKTVNFSEIIERSKKLQ